MAVAGESKKSESDRRRNSVVARAAGLRAYGDETRKTDVERTKQRPRSPGRHGKAQGGG